MSEPIDVPHRDLANAIRALAMDAVQKANSGHPGMPMGMADVATVLFRDFLRFDPSRPHWPNRDRFVLSAGHGSMLLYSLLHLTGYEDMTLDELKRFRQLGSRTAGHPEHGHAEGIETTTGPLGQGLTNAVGMALAEAHLAARFGDGLVDHHTYAIAGDGCLMEGISHEAISLAGHLKLSKLVVFWDDNEISIDGPTDLAVSDDQEKRFEAHGWHVQRCDGHDPVAIAEAIRAAQASDRPSMIACRTQIGYGSPNKANTASAHGSPLGDDEIALTREQLGWSHAPFEIPDAVLEGWRAIGRRGKAARETWEATRDALDGERRAAWERAMSGALPASLEGAITEAKRALLEEQPKMATRASSGKALEVLTVELPEMIGGSADLSGSNKTKTKNLELLTADRYDGRYVHYGVREHAMGAVMNGMALHGGVLPYGGSFLVFTDYARPAIRLSALMKQRVVYVMTHDSIGLGEDGPTHQPIEHLAALRAIPGLLVLRPADTVETLECWELAVKRQGPSVLALTRQGVPAVRTGGDPAENRCAAGAYVLREPDGGRDVTILATGSEVHLALEAAETLAEGGAKAAVVSMPSWELFAAQDEATRRAVLGDAPRVSVEAATTFGWDRWLGDRGEAVGLHDFGASAPYEDLYEHFGITPAKVVEAARRVLG
ncbi:MAG TPA: transketolase [Sandaracinaceae bacterium LLY-WYZ-13_1]|nr:transketolase [Sandaracinaceae bacterium LLY-WYZ-13_1]